MSAGLRWPTIGDRKRSNLGFQPLSVCLYISLLSLFSSVSFISHIVSMRTLNVMQTDFFPENDDSRGCRVGEEDERKRKVSQINCGPLSKHLPSPPHPQSSESNADDSESVKRELELLQK